MRHHRQRRRDGGDRLSNLVLVHDHCHNIHQRSIHQNPADAREYGFIVPAWADPGTYPIFVRNDWYVLTDEGRMIVTDAPD